MHLDNHSVSELVCVQTSLNIKILSNLVGQYVQNSFKVLTLKSVSESVNQVTVPQLD